MWSVAPLVSFVQNAAASISVCSPFQSTERWHLCEEVVHVLWPCKTPRVSKPVRVTHPLAWFILSPHMERYWVLGLKTKSMSITWRPFISNVDIKLKMQSDSSSSKLYSICNAVSPSISLVRLSIANYTHCKLCLIWLWWEIIYHFQPFHNKIIRPPTNIRKNIKRIYFVFHFSYKKKHITFDQFYL
jgi:hypothetical protein